MSKDQFVLDCSVTIAWFAQDEANDYTTSVLAKLLAGSQALVPAIWELEVSNVLLTQMRRNVAPFSQAIEFANDLCQLNIVPAACNISHTLRVIFPLANAENLTSYDAAYLHLAMEAGVPIATLDKKLREAANKLGVGIYLSE